MEIINIHPFNDCNGRLARLWMNAFLLRYGYLAPILTNREDYATVMALTGHKDISMLLRYSHTREEAKRSAINKISGLNYL